MLSSTLRRSFAVRATVLAGAVLAFALLGASAALADTGGTNRPFQATLSGSSVADFSTLSTGSLVQDLTGNESHLGRVTVHDTGAFTLTGPKSFTFSGTEVVTAANGDQLFEAFSGSGSTDAEGNLTSQAVLTVTGGTGRFADASGEQTVTVHGPDASLSGTTLTRTITESITGTISY